MDENETLFDKSDMVMKVHVYWSCVLIIITNLKTTDLTDLFLKVHIAKQHKHSLIWTYKLTIYIVSAHSTVVAAHESVARIKIPLAKGRSLHQTCTYILASSFVVYSWLLHVITYVPIIQDHLFLWYCRSQILQAKCRNDETF